MEEVEKKHEVVYINKNEDYNDKPLEAEKNDSFFLYLAAFTTSLIIFACGSGISWCSPVFPILESTNQDVNPLHFVVNHKQKSHIAATYSLGGAIGSLFAGKLANIMGRKKVLILASIPKLIAILVLAFATKIEVFYVTRLVMGLSLGTAFVVGPMYLAEIAEVHNRGKLGCIMTVFITLGILYPFVIGPFLSFTLFTAACTLPLILFIIFFGLFVPESPVFLVSKERYLETEQVLMQLRNKTNLQIQSELKELKESATHCKSEEGGIGVLFRERTLRKAMVISLGLLLAQQLSGITAVVSFMHSIFEASQTSISQYFSTVSIGIIQVFAAVASTLLVENLGRKILLLISAICCCISMTLLGLFFYSKANNITAISSLFWLPISSIMLYVVSFNGGLAGLPFTVSHEIFPHHVHHIASTIGTSLNFLAGYVITFTFPIIVEAHGMSHGFYLLAIILAIISVFIYFVVPETKGKTIDEIQEMLKNKRLL